jgi:DNA-binding response OmpR family regulator
MHSHTFDKTRVAIGDVKTDSLNSVRHILRDIGFREIEVRRDAGSLQEFLHAADVDLLVSEVDLEDGDAFEMINTLRHGGLGRDPFMPVLGFTWKATPDKVNRAANSGADGLLAQPAWEKRFRSTIEALVEKRKPFVVTTDYIGPDRRTEDDKRGGLKIPLIPAPNALRRSATGLPDAVPFASAMVMIQEQKVERHAYQIDYLTKGITETYREADQSADFAAHVGKLQTVAMDLMLRITDTKYAHQSELCRSLLGLTKELTEGPGKPRLRDISLLGQLSLALQRAIHADDQATVAAAHDIVKAVKTNL